MDGLLRQYKPVLAQEYVVNPYQAIPASLVHGQRQPHYPVRVLVASLGVLGHVSDWIPAAIHALVLVIPDIQVTPQASDVPGAG